jgi:hypothetical protein
MVEFNRPFTLLLLGNSLITIGLILTQNESAKDSVTTMNTNASMNPFERVTWGSLLVEFSLLLIKIKTNDF